MPDWNDLLEEIKAAGSIHDVVRRKYLAKLHRLTGRNVIVYYSGWLQKPTLHKERLAINDYDKNGFMTTIHGLDRRKGLDLILHTPGGELSATESIVDYLRECFPGNIRAVIPQVALSGGTMIACACQSILMGRQSSLGPIDPQLYGMPAHGILEEFEQAYEDIKEDVHRVPVWQPIIAKYSPALIGECQKAIDWSKEIVKGWLISGMLVGYKSEEADSRADKIIKELSDHALTKSHSRHLSASRCKEIGLTVEDVEANQCLQDAVLSVHHACMHSLMATPAFKIIENHEGKAFIQGATVVARTVQVPLGGK